MRWGLEAQNGTLYCQNHHINLNIQVFQPDTRNLLGLLSGTPSWMELSVAARVQQLISPPSSDQAKSSFFSPTSHNLAVPSREHVTMLRPRSTMAVSRMAVDKTHNLQLRLSQLCQLYRHERQVFPFPVMFHVNIQCKDTMF